jgi:tRNA G18 (ribose-2'-O)-methylase SpoU
MIFLYIYQSFVFVESKIYLSFVMTYNYKTYKITSLDLPELQPYRTLRRPLEHIQQGIFVAEGEKVVRRLIDSDLIIISMLMTPQWFDELSKDKIQTSTIARNPSFILPPPIIYIAEKNLLESIVGFNLHQGIMAVAKVPKTLSLEEMIAKVPKPHLLMAMDGLVNAENVGVVVRNCAGFGVDGIIVGETSSSPYLRRAVRNSMGTVFTIPVVHSTNLNESLTILRMKYGTRIIAAHPHEQSSIYSTDFKGNVCIVLGNEGEGVSNTVLDTCDLHVAIPMMKGTDSLNVASASAVFLYEVRKQRDS